MLDALKNFHYDEIKLGIDREIGGETVVKLNIRGKNPELYDGYPVVLNLSLSGRLDEILLEAGVKTST